MCFFRKVCLDVCRLRDVVWLEVVEEGRKDKISRELRGFLR